MKFQIYLNKFLFGIILLFSSILNAQEEMQVTRCLAAEFRRPVVNVFSDESNNIWASDGKNLHQIQAADLATPVKLNAGEQSILNFPGGNQDFRFQQEALDAILGADFGAISAAFYDQQREELWIGTTEGGVFQVKANSGLKLLNNYTNKNSKLKSNHINTILVDQTGETWIGTKEGMFVGKGSRWTLEEKLFSFDRVVERGSTVWILGDDFLWKVNSRGDWNPVDLDVRQLEGLIRDFAIDLEGRLWIASEIITRFDPDTDEYKKFGPIEYYTSQYATSLVVDGAGAVWIGTEDKGVYLIGKASGMAVSCLVTKELNCNSDKNDAALEVKISGGEAPYTYAWSNGLKGENPQNLGPGEYAVTVTDSKGKSRVAQAIIENPRFTVEVKQDKEESLPGAADGAASIIIAGSASNFKFQWDNGETTQKATKLNTGNHSVTVTDQKGCSATGTISIGQGVAPMAINIEQISAIKCAESNDAALKVSVTGGKGPFQYKWSDPKLIGEQPTNIAPSSYQLQVIDATGNSESAIISIKAPEALSANVQVQSPASTGNSDGKAIVNAKGGNGNYSFKWDNGETTQTATKLAPGKHNVTITDINGCSTTASVEITENILPLAIALNETNPIKCAGASDASITVQVSGGKAPFQYLWNDTKLNGENPKGLAAGDYQITVTDAAGNKANANISIKAPEALSASIQVQSPASTGNSDGKAIVNAKGGNGNYSFKWDNGETTQTATKLAPGKHNVTITDINGCSTTASVEITENILPLVVAIKEINSIKCSGNADAAITVQVSGGKAPFQYLWNDPILTGSQVSNLKPGDYNVSVTDALGTTKSANIKIAEPTALAAEITKKRGATTEATKDGKATVEAKGGVGNYTFKWDNGETEAAAKQLPMGTHTVTVSDANNCQTTTSVEIVKRILPTLTLDMLKTGEAIRMEQLQFDADSTTINEPSMPVLNELFDFLTDNPAIVVEIGGHTNNLPPDDYCDRISTERAQAVSNYLVGKGIDPKRLYAKGYGKRKPIASNDTADGRRRNQRVEIRILELNDGG
ncbi:MAG: OmpA family protein [Saprospiraceae bacterium]|nr:OmpA family protein [Saprospiraceae bacterium]